MLPTEKHRSRNRKRLEQQEQKQPEAGQYGVAVKMRAHVSRCGPIEHILSGDVCPFNQEKAERFQIIFRQGSVTATFPPVVLVTE